MPQLRGGGDPRVTGHEDSRAGIGGGLDAEIGQDHVSLGRPCTAVEQMPAELGPFRVIPPGNVFLWCVLE